MEQLRLAAAFIRGGTSKAVFFKGSDLPADKLTRDRIFCHVLGSPDPYGRQLNGMGGGLSSLSKVVIVEPSSRKDADIDYTFVQIAVDEAVADYSATCGNMSSAVGPFAVDEGMFDVSGDQAEVKVYNTNTGKHFIATFPVKNGKSIEQGDFDIPGVAGSGAKIQLDYLSPGGAATGKLLPSGNAIDTLTIDGVGDIEVSMVDSANPIAFVRASDLNCSGVESPTELDADRVLMGKLENIRRTASVAMGISDSPETTPLANPRVAMIGEPKRYTGLDGRIYNASDYQVSVRLISMGNIHKAIPLTGAMCVATAARIPGSIVQSLATSGLPIHIGNPSGLVPVEADVCKLAETYDVLTATSYRTQRRIMEGNVLFPAKFIEESQ